MQEIMIQLEKRDTNKSHGTHGAIPCNEGEGVAVTHSLSVCERVCIVGPDLHLGFPLCHFEFECSF